MWNKNKKKRFDAITTTGINKTECVFFRHFVQGQALTTWSWGRQNGLVSIL